MTTTYATAAAIAPRRTQSWLRRGSALFAATAGLVIGLTGPGAAGASPATAPSQPIYPPIAAGGYNATLLSWDVPADNGSPITAFRISAYEGATFVGQGTVPAGAVGSSLDPTPSAFDYFNVSGQPGGVALSYTVAATNGVGTGPQSPNSGVVTPSATPVAPYAPLAVVASSAAPFQGTLQWVVPPNNGAAITSFILTAQNSGWPTKTASVPVGTVGSALDPTPGATDRYTFTGLENGGTDLTVQAVNSIGPSAQSRDAIAGVGGPALELPGPYANFPNTTLGDFTEKDLQASIGGADGPDSITNITFSGTGANDYSAETTCENTPSNGSCSIRVFFNPGALGSRPATMTISDDSPNQMQVPLTGQGTIGYYVAGAAGEIGNFGDAAFYGDASSVNLNRPIVALTTTGDDGGYWLTASDGGIFAFGDAPFFGSTGNIRLNQPIVGMAVTPDGGGYWMVASDGGIFSFGDAPFYGSTGSIRLNKPIVGMAVTPDGGGYWLVASDGGIFSFGDAPFYGSTGAIHLNKPIVGMAVTPDGGGYWMVASDGGIFTFGKARFLGSTGGIHVGTPIVGMTLMPDGLGYWLAASDGQVFAFGDAPYQGSVADNVGGVTDAIGIATDGPPTLQATFDVPASRHGHTAHALHEAIAHSVRAATSGQWSRP
jgi:hypothetical protein